mmetsp:Transcript_15228/g.57484  ORF Transcript_15228/g.57484 Transcript_15228/m.57484 type:complete len:317 (+) Transcript_15228:2240-3190(+)
MNRRSAVPSDRPPPPLYRFDDDPSSSSDLPLGSDHTVPVERSQVALEAWMPADQVPVEYPEAVPCNSAERALLYRFRPNARRRTSGGPGGGKRRAPGDLPSTICALKPPNSDSTETAPRAASPPRRLPTRTAQSTCQSEPRGCRSPERMSTASPLTENQARPVSASTVTPTTSAGRRGLAASPGTAAAPWPHLSHARRGRPRSSIAAAGASLRHRSRAAAEAALSPKACEANSSPTMERAWPRACHEAQATPNRHSAPSSGRSPTVTSHRSAPQPRCMMRPQAPTVLGGLPTGPTANMDGVTVADVIPRGTMEVSE